MQFLADENFPSASTNRLREMGHDVAAVATDYPGASDEEVLTRAAAEARIVLTFDRDYGELVFRLAQPIPAGVVYLRFEVRYPEEPADRLLELLDARDFSVKGNFTVVGRDRVRRQRRLL